MAQKTVYISKLLSLMLRHRPDEFGLDMDEHGFVDLDAVLAALQEKDASFSHEDIEHVVYDGEKQRFEIVGGRIRARYGHSFPIDLGIDPTEPPEFLYKGVDAADVEHILANGLSPEDRSYVHLSFEADVAARLSSRPGRRGAVIRVEALRAHENDVHFYDCGPTVLSAQIPPEFLAVERAHERDAYTVSHDEAANTSADDNEEVTYGRRRRFSSRR